jgi:hypothetical protein
VLLLKLPAAKLKQQLNIPSLRINDEHSSIDFGSESWHENVVSIQQNAI